MAIPDQDVVQNFMKYDYAETKDLIKTFLTLISATLVLSLTFSEKVIGVNRAARNIKRFLLGSWILFILALVCAGLAMCFIAAAAGTALYGAIPLMNLDAGQLALISWMFILGAGASYIAGLVSLTIATGRSLFGAPKSPQEPTDL